MVALFAFAFAGRRVFVFRFLDIAASRPLAVAAPSHPRARPLGRSVVDRAVLVLLALRAYPFFRKTHPYIHGGRPDGRANAKKKPLGFT